jgi:hypothetical protein
MPRAKVAVGLALLALAALTAGALILQHVSVTPPVLVGPPESSPPAAGLARSPRMATPQLAAVAPARASAPVTAPTTPDAVAEAGPEPTLSPGASAAAQMLSIMRESAVSAQAWLDLSPEARERFDLAVQAAASRLVSVEASASSESDAERHAGRYAAAAELRRELEDIIGAERIASTLEFEEDQAPPLEALLAHVDRYNARRSVQSILRVSAGFGGDLAAGVPGLDAEQIARIDAELRRLGFQLEDLQRRAHLLAPDTTAALLRTALGETRERVVQELGEVAGSIYGAYRDAWVAEAVPATLRSAMGLR